ncbi:hypothetical protein NQ176_g2208 [Zarea fungicola]|uniref:Uncharacterized protein n=1 Tax=Zarea fungicola TaxID=93591 RepID=A0ACC1NQE6_9HYPO|nr:hypothetical protein NQ176_g2208 [Lecanicillium fungicola]
MLIIYIGEDGDYRYLAQCSGLGGSMCCGLDYECCNGTAILTSIPIFTTLSPPGGIPATSTTRSSTVSTSATSSGVASSATGSSEPQSHSSKPAADKSVAIGAGVGVPLGVALLAAICLLTWQMRKRAAAEKDLKTATAHSYTHVEQKPTPIELYTPQPVSELPTNEANRS